ncbi:MULTISPECIES: GntR family transcriptional regulator [Pseudomonas]|uniref:GntR family transcriptional regulator n=1 Tax=Pseudomonas oryzihabitans TaxID=47885 RepID=A0A178LD72_9PSED|nr:MULTISPECIES: GntR family transcriptional regulator [Pseudomonas]KXJ32287.1 GntR family transcriptional regulator [Pseudomonas sp. HUK17]NRH42050.1 GntR family transcriptional regulator [Pseudomonas sp. MS15a(2019)]OAN26762.1 GntR family transcriptional regulator [Pseudomonas oryzihabitans]SEO72995.1 DNA-binding transcriptional regulator, GntR family [Pseudomonas sp. Snoq117.2]
MGTTLASQLIPDILTYIASHQLAVGTRLPERTLAERLRVSRSPVRSALQQMADQSLLARHPEGGFAVAAAALDATPQAREEVSASERLYLTIARDRIEGELPLKVTENELIRRYQVTRGQLADILRRIVQEGWAERLPGYGWSFVEGLTSPDAYAQSYAFRLLIEPAGIRDADFTLDAGELRRCRDEQALLAAGRVFEASPAEIFDANTRLHETIARCSGNAFILDALRRLNRLRRLIEYQKSVDRQQAQRRCQEHLQLIDLLLEGRREEAATFMTRHLGNALQEKQATAAR